MVDSGSSQKSSDEADWPLDSMIRALETASAPDELGLWADRIAAVCRTALARRRG